MKLNAIVAMELDILLICVTDCEDGYVRTMEGIRIGTCKRCNGDGSIDQECPYCECDGFNFCNIFGSTGAIEDELE